MNGAEPFAPTADFCAAGIALGSALEQLGDYPAAMARFAHAADVARNAEWPALRARALLGMARVEHALGDVEDAAAKLDNCAALATAIDRAENPQGIQVALSSCHDKVDEVYRHSALPTRQAMPGPLLCRPRPMPPPCALAGTGG
ncbi:MAG: hypothetical protein H7Z19_08340 [Chitinophagaceae bacterium]|nr:hypothetical protein [Rubrivivax sp.]